MTTILVTTTERSTGKTAVALALALVARDDGQTVGYMKPKGTRRAGGVEETVDSDPALARELLALDADIEALEPVVYSPTFIEEVMRGRRDPAAVRERVSEQFATLAADRDLMIVEGASHLTTGGAIDLADPDLAALLDARVVHVTGYTHPGDIDDVLAATDAIGDRLSGLLFNDVPAGSREMLTETAVPFLEGRNLPVRGALPRTRELAGVSVADFAAALGAEVLTEGDTDARVGTLLVGAMGADASLRYFRRATDAAVITGGDRSDIHTVALEAPGVTCLCLTGGFQPSDAVVGRAERRGVPILRVDGDTLSTVERAERIIQSGRVRDAEPIKRMRELLDAHADVDALLS